MNSILSAMQKFGTSIRDVLLSDGLWTLVGVVCVILLVLALVRWLGAALARWAR